MSKLQPNLNRLTRKRKQGKGGSLPAAENRPAIGPSISVARVAGSSGGDGIASPLTEQSRLKYAGTMLYSSDGFFTLSVYPVKEIAFTDAEGREVVLEFNSPG